MLAWWALLPRQMIQIGPSERFARHDVFVDQKASLAHGCSSIWDEGRPGIPVLGLERSREAGGQDMLDQSRHLGLWEVYTAFGQDDGPLTTWSDDSLSGRGAAPMRFAGKPCFCLDSSLQGIPGSPPHASGFYAD
jgi:hypothetical protein